MPDGDPRLNRLFYADDALLSTYEETTKKAIERHQIIRVLTFNQMGNPDKDRLEKMEREVHLE